MNSFPAYASVVTESAFTGGAPMRSNAHSVRVVTRSPSQSLLSHVFFVRQQARAEIARSSRAAII